MAKANISRRWFVGALGTAVLAAPAFGEAAAAGAPSSGAAERLLSPLRPGDRLARWTLVTIEPPARGAVGVVVKDAEGHLFRLEILARDPSPIGARPPAETEHFAVFVENGGDGWSPTIEEQGIAAMAVAQLIRRNEAEALAAGFLTHSERIARHAGALLPRDQG